MNWFLIALLPPALWAITNHLDKYLISRYFKGGGVGALIVFSALIGLFIIPFILVIFPFVVKINLTIGLLIALNGWIYVLAILPYLHALNRDETSIAVPLFQMVSVFSFFLAWIILKETLAFNQIIGGVFIILGAVTLSLELEDGKKVGFKNEVFWLMMLSSFLFAVNFLFFKFFALRQDFWTTSFWEYVGFTAFGFVLLAFHKKYRQEFNSVIKANRVPVIGLNFLNEIVNIGAKMTFNFASLLAPIALTHVVSGFQPLFVFSYGVILTLLFPHIVKENIAKKALAHKLIAIIIIFIGTFLINR